jgi:hypothetical protein
MPLIYFIYLIFLSFLLVDSSLFLDIDFYLVKGVKVYFE